MRSTVGKDGGQGYFLAFLSGYSWKDRATAAAETRPMEDGKWHLMGSVKKMQPFACKLNVCIHFLGTYL